jgi:hypothetical protein
VNAAGYDLVTGISGKVGEWGLRRRLNWGRPRGSATGCAYQSHLPTLGGYPEEVERIVSGIPESGLDGQTGGFAAAVKSDQAVDVGVTVATGLGDNRGGS